MTEELEAVLKESEDTVVAIWCNRCQGNKISRSRRQTVTDWMLVLLGLRPFRCRECGNRFYRPFFRIPQERT